MANRQFEMTMKMVLSQKPSQNPHSVDEFNSIRRYSLRIAFLGFTVSLLSSLVISPVQAKSDAPGKGKASTEAKIKLPALDEAKLKPLLDAGVLVQKLSSDTELLDVNFSLSAKKLNAKHFEQLAAVSDYVRWLNLANTDVNDGQLKQLAGLKNLSKLHLEKTGITDAGLDHVKALSGLEYLNLYGTKVSDAGVAKLEGLTNLKKVFLWQTDVTEAGAKKLHAKIPESMINLGHGVGTLDPVVLAASVGSSAVAANVPKAPALPELPKMAALDDAKLKPLAGTGVLVQKLAANTDMLDVNFSLGNKEVSDDQIKKLVELGDYVVWLNLAGTKVTDAQLKEVAKLKNLSKLHIEKTEITDAGLDALKGLTRLQYLNIYNTKVTDKGLASLEPHKHLRKLYLWQTAVSEDAAKKLHEKNPFMYVNLGNEKPALKPIDLVFTKPSDKPPETEKEDEGLYAAVPDTPTYEVHIKPVFERSCVDCHGEKKQKGKLRLDTPDWINKGEVIVAKNVFDSLVHERITLDQDDDEFMPPPDKAQVLTKVEVDTIQKWIEQGAAFN